MSTDEKAMAPAEKSIDELLAEKELAKEKREQGRLAQAKARRLQALELEEKYEAELGARGKYFDIVATIEGPIVVKLGEAGLFKTWQTKVATKAAPSLEDCHAFVIHNVLHPSKEQFNKITSDFPAVIVTCANALTALYQGNELTAQGK